MASFDSWLYLLIAIPFGVLGTISMKLSHGLQKWKPSVCIIIFYSISFVAMTFALKTIDLSLAYAIWSGVGTILVSMIGIMVFEEAITNMKVFSLLLIVLGVIGMHLTNVFH